MGWASRYVELLKSGQTVFAGATGPQLVFRHAFDRDRLGRVTRKTEIVSGVQSVYDYSYDASGRLIQVQTNGSVSESYTYDANGNRLTAGGVAATYDDQDRLLTFGNTSFTYTANGDLVSRTQAGQTTTYAYDLFGNLLSSQLPDGRTVGYVIDGQNRRVGKRINGALTQGFLYQDTLRVVAELDGAGNVVSRFIYGTRLNVPDYMVRGGVTYRIVADHLGSPRLVVNSVTGEVAQRMDYDTFGNVTSDTSPGFQPFGFAGGLYDRDTRLIRFGARDYDPQVGRWTAKDPILFSGGQGNLYAYSVSDPVNFIDADGRNPFAIGGAAIGSLFAFYKYFPAYMRGEISSATLLKLWATHTAAGALAGFGGGFFGGALLGGLASGSTNLIEQLLTTDSLCVSRVRRAAGIGAGVGALSGLVTGIGTMFTRPILNVPLAKAGKDYSDVSGVAGFFGGTFADLALQ